jgi:hypothetical protein
MSDVSFGGIELDARQVWLRAFYGFNPEEEGYIGFTHETQRESVLERMRDGDLVLIYGAVESLTQPDLRSQALGFLEVTCERCVDRERQSTKSIAWKIERGFEDRWTYGIKVRRAWRVQNRVSIKTIAPKAYANRNRFERTTRAILLEQDERRRALSHPVRQVNVYGEPLIAAGDLPSGPMEALLKPSKGIPPSYGHRTSEHEDGENHLYLMMLSASAEVILGRTSENVGKALVKIGRSNDPRRRIKEINEGFPERAAFRWKLVHHQAFESGEVAHKFETELKRLFDSQFKSQGNEFFTGERQCLETQFQTFCVSRMPRIMGAAAKAKGIK